MKKFAALTALFMVMLAVTYASSSPHDAVPGLLNNIFRDTYTFEGGQIQTPVTKTAAFTAALDKYKYDLSTSGGAYVVSLPASTANPPPADGQCWEFSLTVAGNAASFSPSAVGDLLDGSQAAYAGMDALGDSAKICYDASTTNYYFQARYIH